MLKWHENKKITARYQVVTPMFIGDFEQKPTDITAASFKGALRYWWRATNWNRTYIENDCETINALKQLHADEAALFGVPTNKSYKDIGQSSFNLHVKIIDRKGIGKQATWLGSGNNGLRYLGMGLFEMGDESTDRCYLKENTTFEVELSFLPERINSQQQSQLEKALMTIGLIGGLGSNSRNAYGSLCIRKLNDKNIEHRQEDDYIKNIKEMLLLENFSDNCPPYTALSENTTFVNASPVDTAKEAQALLGDQYMGFRKAKNLRDNGCLPELKKYMGLPLKDHGDERRASPLFMHIHPIGYIGSEKYIPLLFFIPSKFHTEYEEKLVCYDLINKFMQNIRGL